jgi:hypothetical protein
MHPDRESFGGKLVREPCPICSNQVGRLDGFDIIRKLSSLNVEAITSMETSTSSTSAERYDHGPAITVDSANRRGYSRRRWTSSTFGNSQPTEPDLADPWTKLQV